jgi:hypothetical protein
VPSTTPERIFSFATGGNAVIGVVGIAPAGAAAPTLHGSPSSGGAPDVLYLDLALPPAATQGDLLVAFVAQNGGMYDDVATPSGWTKVVEADDLSGPTGARNHVFWKVADAGEPASFRFATVVKAHDLAGGMFAISGARIGAPIEAVATTHTTTMFESSLAAPPVTSAVPDLLLLYECSGVGLTSVTPPTDLVEYWDVLTTGTYKITNEACSALLQ